MDVGVSVKPQIIGVFVKKIVYEIHVRLIVSVIKEYLDIVNCSCEKLGKLELAFEDEILNKSETSLVNIKSNL